MANQGLSGSRELAFRLAEYVNSHGIFLVLLAGDLFDSAAPYRETGEALAAAFGRMNARVCAAPRNHDFYGPGGGALHPPPAGGDRRQRVGPPGFGSHPQAGRTEALWTLCAWPGCVEGRGFDELGEKGFYEGVIDGGAVSLTFVPFARRRYEILNVDVTGAAAPKRWTTGTFESKKNAEKAENLFCI